MNYVVPLSYAFTTWPFGGSMADSIAFRNQDDKFTALGNMFHIYSNAGNVSYAGYDRNADKVPWEFHAFEILFYMCVNTYETVYEAGRSNTTVVNSSNVPLRGTINGGENLPTYNSGCYFPPGLDNDQGSGDMCEHIEKPGSFTALQDPNFPNDTSKSYAMDRYIGATITGELFYKARNTYVGDGVATHRGVSSGAGADAVKEALWGPAQLGNFTTAQRFARLRAFCGGFATSLSNGSVYASPFPVSLNTPKKQRLTLVGNKDSAQPKVTRRFLRVWPGHPRHSSTSAGDGRHFWRPRCCFRICSLP